MPTRVDLVLFRWGALHLAIQASQVAGLELATDPGVPTIGDLLAWSPGAGLSAGPAPPRQLHLAWPGGALRVRVQEPVTQVRLPLTASHPLPPLLAARLRLPGVRALAFRQIAGTGALTLILDAQSLPSRIH